MAVLLDTNEAFLDAALGWLRQRLEGEPAPAGEALEFLSQQPAGVAFHRICAMFRLNSFERHALLLAAAPEIDEAFGTLIAQAQGVSSRWPQVSLAWRLFCRDRQEWLSSRDSLRTDGNLLRFELLHLEDAGLPLPDRSLRVDRRVADALLGRTLPDERIAPMLRIIPPAATGNWLAPRLAAVNGPLFVHLYGSMAADLEAFAAQAVAGIGLPLLCADAAMLAGSTAVALAREGLLTQSALLLRVPAEPDAAWIRLLRDSGAITFLVRKEKLSKPLEVSGAEWLEVEVPQPGAPEQRQLWAADFAGAAEYLSRQYHLSPSEILECRQTAATAAWAHGRALADSDALQACASHARHRMAEFADPVTLVNGWSDLILPAETLGKLHELCQQVEQREKVMETYGFGRKMPRGRGVCALFAGPSGTGKTMSAEVIAAHLGRELYRISIPRTVSKYIGETEKILREAVQECERSRSVLLFDEADAFFGKRTEVKDSHDRFANIQVSYLLQLVEEADHAVLLLATNRRDAIDEAFLRRFRFVVDFPAPDRGLRKELWRASLPAAIRMQGVDLDSLADRLAVTGASIKNIALAASYMAAADGGVVTAAMIAKAARRELEKLGKPATFAESEIERRGAPA
ncbi:MAG: ATP-binding protein [Acidobacteria bacterium]|nr:ATP-binding protein [Acidobacteriota bacterium]